MHGCIASIREFGGANAIDDPCVAWLMPMPRHVPLLLLLSKGNQRQPRHQLTHPTHPTHNHSLLLVALWKLAPSLGGISHVCTYANKQTMWDTIVSNHEPPLRRSPKPKPTLYIHTQCTLRPPWTTRGENGDRPNNCCRFCSSFPSLAPTVSVDIHMAARASAGLVLCVWRVWKGCKHK